MATINGGRDHDRLRRPAIGQWPSGKIETDAEQLARAVLDGDDQAAYMLADEVIDRAGQPAGFVSRAMLKEYLRAAILTTWRTTNKVVKYDSAGSTYEVDWRDDVQLWAKACDLDLSQHSPTYYSSVR